jgi:ABC-type nitrate/sulfonate/bicarbonate transport system permease component
MSSASLTALPDVRRRWLAWLFFACVLIAWELAVRVAGKSAVMPYPTGVFQAAVRTIGDGSLVAATSGSLFRVFLGFAIGAAFGIPLGVLMGFLRPLNRALSPIVDSLRSIAPIAWIPMALLWLGIRGNAAVFIVTYAAFFPFVVNTVQGARLIDRNLVNAARALGASRGLILRSVILPSAVPAILTGARIAMAFAWGSIIAAELAMGIKVTAGGSGAVGLGQLMVSTLYIRRDVNGLVLYMIVIGVIALLIDLAMRRLQRTLTPWRQS